MMQVKCFNGFDITKMDIPSANSMAELANNANKEEILNQKINGQLNKLIRNIEYASKIGEKSIKEWNLYDTVKRKLELAGYTVKCIRCDREFNKVTEEQYLISW